MKSLCKARAVVDTSDANSSALCMETAGSSRRSPLLTNTGCGELAEGARAQSHSSSRWCSPCPRQSPPDDWARNHCHRRLCCRASWEEQNAGSCMVCS